MDRDLQVKFANQYSAETVASNLKTWKKNLKENWYEIIHGNDASLIANSFGQRIQADAVIIGAGESLDHALKHLPGIVPRAVLICADKALKGLLSHGIRPDIVVTIDQKAGDVGLFDDVDARGIFLLMSSLQNISIQKKWHSQGGTVLWYLQGRFPHKEIVGMYNDLQKVKPMMRVPSAGGITGTLIATAQMIGCKKALLVGMDLCFRELPSEWERPFFRMYAECIQKDPTDFGHLWEQHVVRCTLPGVWTKPEFATMHMLAIEAYIKHIKMFSISPYRMAEQYGVVHGSWEKLRPEFGYKLINKKKAFHRKRKYVVGEDGRVKVI